MRIQAALIISILLTTILALIAGVHEGRRRAPHRDPEASTRWAGFDLGQVFAKLGRAHGRC